MRYSGISLLDFYGKWMVNLDPKFKMSVNYSNISSDESKRMASTLRPFNSPHLAIAVMDELEVSPFKDEKVNVFKVSSQLSVISNVIGDTRHYYPFCSEAINEEILLSYIEFILESTYPCLRYEITDRSIIALTESHQLVTSVSKNVKMTTYPRWEFHFDFFQSYMAIPLSFQSPSNQYIDYNSGRVRSSTYSEEVVTEMGIHKPRILKDTINLIDYELIDIINKISRDQLDSMEDRYMDYERNIDHDRSRDKKVTKFYLQPYHKNLIRLLWSPSPDQEYIADFIEYLIIIVGKIERLNSGLSFPYIFNVIYHYDTAIVNEFELESK